MKKLLLFVGLQLIFACAFGQEEKDTGIVKVIKYPKGFTAQLNLIYTQGEHWASKMDLYLPPKGSTPTPVIINIHGGGWGKGTKDAQSGFGEYFKVGWGVANINYRLTPEATAPAAIEDCRCALIYLIRNAKELNIDVNKIVVMGSSAGAHLALLTGLLDNDHRFEKNCPGVKKLRIAAIVDKFGLADAQFAVDGANGTVKDRSFIRWLGMGATDPKFVASMSPITYVKKNSPPVFIVHGDADPRIPYQQSVRMHEALDKVGAVNQFMTVPGGLHGGFPPDKKQELNVAIMEFLAKQGIVPVPFKQ